MGFLALKFIKSEHHWGGYLRLLEFWKFRKFSVFHYDSSCHHFLLFYIIEKKKFNSVKIKLTFIVQINVNNLNLIVCCSFFFTLLRNKNNLVWTMSKRFINVLWSIAFLYHFYLFLYHPLFCLINFLFIRKSYFDYFAQ